MKNRIGWHEVFEQLAPPPGGLAALRARIDRAAAVEPNPWWGTRTRLAAAAVAAVTLCLVTLLAVAPALWSGQPGRSVVWLDAVAADGNPALVRLGLAAEAADAQPVSVPPGARHGVAVERVEVNTPGVIYYRVAVLPGW